LRRGDIYYCELGEPLGHEQGWSRPVLIVSAEQTLEYGFPVVLPITRTRTGYPTHIEIDDVDMMRVERVLRRLLVL
jgi:mRNA interferase MazF